MSEGNNGKSTKGIDEADAPSGSLPLLVRHSWRCPRCERGTLIFEPWGVGRVAVCRHVKQCGFRLYIEAYHVMSFDEIARYIQRNWRSA